MRALAGIAVLVALAGCGGDKSESLPRPCTEGPAAIVKALAKAPANVSIDGTTPISQCFNRDASGNDVQIVGTFLLSAAQQLGDRARQGDEQSALRLGYLVGAAQRGARRNGLGSEIVRRIEAETDGLGSARAAYQRGLRAGLVNG